jgi:TetR/AcrR family transcriptional regulator, regulator of autoinduction and epiphytic fitness
MGTSRPRAESPTRERNRAKIVDAARQLWSRTPDASMDDVAREAGVVRRTLYGHFTHRDDLILAVADRAAEVLLGIAGRSPRRGVGAAEELARLSLQVWSFAHDWHLLAILAQQVDANSVERAVAPINAAFDAVVRRGQRNGEFSSHLPTEVMAQILQVQAVKLHEASDIGLWNGGAGDAAVSALITVGVDRVVAARIVAAVKDSALKELKQN